MSNVHPTMKTALDPFTPEIELRNGRYYRFAGRVEAVRELSQMIFDRYPQAGYGTCIRSLRDLADGGQECVIWRAFSCD